MSPPPNESKSKDKNGVVSDHPPLVGSLRLGLLHVAVKLWLLLQGMSRLAHLRCHHDLHL